jgi:Mlc titration factor MtfA (ptsG expression regulator)
VPTILIYPAGFKTPKVRRMGDYALVGEQALAGEAQYRGPVVLNWADVQYQSDHLGEGDNLVWHEFAHQLDMLDGQVDGTPPLESDDLRRRWHDVMTAEFKRLAADARRRLPTLLHPGGAQDPGEFFAYSTECFFDCPAEMRQEHPKLYQLLAEYYRQDPAARVPGRHGRELRS